MLAAQATEAQGVAGHRWSSRALHLLARRLWHRIGLLLAWLRWALLLLLLQIWRETLLLLLGLLVLTHSRLYSKGSRSL